MLTLVIPILNERENDKCLILRLLFHVSDLIKTFFEALQRSVIIEICHFLFQLIILKCLRQEVLIKRFLLEFLLISEKMATNMKLALLNVHFRHNSACPVQKCLRVIRAGLAHISRIFPN